MYSTHTTQRINEYEIKKYVHGDHKTYTDLCVNVSKFFKLVSEN